MGWHDCSSNLPELHARAQPRGRAVPRLTGCSHQLLSATLSTQQERSCLDAADGGRELSLTHELQLCRQFFKCVLQLQAPPMEISFFCLRRSDDNLAPYLSGGVLFTLFRQLCLLHKTVAQPGCRVTVKSA